MNSDEIAKYKEYVFKMSDDQLDAETYAVVKQQLSSMAITLCYTEWRNRGKAERFLKAYNKTLPPIEKDFH